MVNIILCLIVSPLLSWGCMNCDTCSVPLLVLCTRRIIQVVPMMRGHLVYYELLLLSQVGLMVCGWNKIIRICEYRMIFGEGLFIAWANLYWLLPAVRFCTTIEYESICLRCKFLLWNGYWTFESLSVFFALWLLGGTNWYLMFMEVIVIFKAVDASLSMNGNLVWSLSF